MTGPWKNANFLWIGSNLSPVEILALKSHLATGWNVIIYTYGDIEGIPVGCNIRNGREILDDSLIFLDKETGAPGVSYSNFADMFRWSLLSKQAGWWFDMDMVSILPPQPIPDATPMRFGSTWEHEWRQCAINCAMYSNGQAALFGEAYQCCLDILANGDERSFPELGPFMLQRLVREGGFEQYVAPWWEFCPYPWRQIKSACSENTREHISNQMRVIKHSVQAATGGLVRPARIRSGTKSVHLHNEIWRRSGLAKTGPFSKHSFVGSQMLKYQVPGVAIV